MILLWEELFRDALWFGATGSSASPLIFSPALRRGGDHRPVAAQTAAVLAVVGAVLFGLVGVLLCVNWLWAAGLPPAALSWQVGTMLFGAVRLAGGMQRRGVLPAGISGAFGAARARCCSDLAARCSRGC